MLDREAAFVAFDQDFEGAIAAPSARLEEEETVAVHAEQAGAEVLDCDRLVAPLNRGEDPFRIAGVEADDVCQVRAIVHQLAAARGRELRVPAAGIALIG